MLNTIIKITIQTIALVLLLLINGHMALANSNQIESINMSNISPAEAKKLIKQHKNDQDFIIIDVRTLAEYEKGHIPQAKLLDSASPTLDQDLASLKRNATYIIYCRSGRRSLGIIEKMQNMGFSSVKNIEGGFSEWTKQGFEEEK